MWKRNELNSHEIGWKCYLYIYHNFGYKCYIYHNFRHPFAEALPLVARRQVLDEDVRVLVLYRRQAATQREQSVGRARACRGSTVPELERGDYPALQDHAATVARGVVDALEMPPPLWCRSAVPNRS